MSEKLVIAGISVEPGKRVIGKVKADSFPSGDPINIPIILVNGRKSGPILCLNSGIHGTEYDGIEIVRKAALGVDPNELSGAIVAIPGSNPPDFIARMWGGYPHLGGGNPWLSYPGDPKGSWSKKLVYFLFNEIFSKTNYILDFHSGGRDMIARYIYGCDTQATVQKVAKAKEELIKAFGTGLPVYYEVLKKEAAPMLSHFAGMQGIPEITVEIGGGGLVLEKNTRRGMKGIDNIMKHLKMIKGKAEPSEQVFFTKIQSIWADHCGLLIPKVSPWKTPYKVSKDEVIAVITDMSGNELEVIKSELNGVVYISRADCGVNSGDWVYDLGSGSTTWPLKPIISEEVYT